MDEEDSLLVRVLVSCIQKLLHYFVSVPINQVLNANHFRTNAVQIASVRNLRPVYNKMNKLLTLILLSAATPAFAANPYVGASVGYLVESEEPMFTARIGTDVAQVGQLTHSVEVDVSLVTETTSGVTVDLIPAMLNYRISGPLGQGPTRFYFGGGAGFTRLKAYGWGYKLSDWAFSLQALGGIEHKVTPKFSLTLGLRYLWTEDFTLGGIDIDSGDEVAIEAGVRFQF